MLPCHDIILPPLIGSLTTTATGSRLCGASFQTKIAPMKIARSDFRFSKTVHLQYLLHVPEQVQKSSGEKWPTILFLHGLGESGDDPSAVLRAGLPRYVTERADFPFIVVAPQCPWNAWWPSGGLPG